LFQQYIVDAWASCEQRKMNFIRDNQKKLRAEVYQGLQDITPGDPQNAAAYGQRKVLPSSVVGSPCFMNQLFQDSMAIVCKFGVPDIFLTMTANPRWPEIDANLFAGQTASDQPDIVARVFELKKNELLCKVMHGFFGAVAARVHTIEFQKCGLPHMHLLIFLQHQDHIRDTDHINSMVSAQLPDPETHPQLFEVVTSFMLHGPCGPQYPNAKCMVNGKCSKGFPKPWQERTEWAENGYPKYARPQNGHTFFHNGFNYTNQWVICHSPHFLLVFFCHINVEISLYVGSVKYVSKYMTKGVDKATLEVTAGRGVDEVKAFLDARYLSPPEGCWHIFEFGMHSEFPVVYQLPIHLPGQHLVYFDPEESVEAIMERQNVEKTELTAWLDYN
jgi:hypothetical protein